MLSASPDLSAEIYTLALGTLLTPRSEEFRKGMQAAINDCVAQPQEDESCPHCLGTAQADAWRAGHVAGYTFHQQWTGVLGRARLREVQPTPEALVPATATKS